jgi:hypothetical protein
MTKGFSDDPVTRYPDAPIADLATVMAPPQLLSH